MLPTIYELMILRLLIRANEAEVPSFINLRSKLVQRLDKYRSFLSEEMYICLHYCIGGSVPTDFKGDQEPSIFVK